MQFALASQVSIISTWNTEHYTFGISGVNISYCCERDRNIAPDPLISGIVLILAQSAEKN